MSSLRVLILDFDGVVVESNDVKTDAFRKVFARFPEYADKMMEYHHANVSLTRFAKFDRLLSLMGRPDDAALKADIAEDFSRRVVDAMMNVPLVAGADYFLRKITQRVPVYLASVTPDRELAMIIERRGLDHWFIDIYGCPPWTKADAIRDVLAREKVDPGEALLVGDSAGDQRAAQMAGVNFLGRDSGLLFDSPAPLVFPDMNHIARHIEELLK